MLSIIRDRKEIKKTFGELKARAESFQLDDLTSGAWLITAVGDALEGYSEERTPAYFRRRYPGLESSQIIERRIERAKRHAALEGALTAGAVTTAVAATIASGGSASLVTMPAGVVVFVTDLLFSTRLQLRLAYDISVLSGHRVSLDEPEEVRELLRVALGEKPEEGEELDVDDGFTDTARRTMRQMTEGTVKYSRKALSYLGRRLLRTSLIKLTLPAASIPLSSAMNYYSTGRTAERARRVYLDRARVRDVAPNLAKAGVDAPRLLLEALWVIIDADERNAVQESRLLKEVKRALILTDAGKDAVTAVDALGYVRESDVLDGLRQAPTSVSRSIFEAVAQAAMIDHELSRRERGVLARLAAAAKIDFDAKKLTR